MGRDRAAVLEHHGQWVRAVENGGDIYFAENSSRFGGGGLYLRDLRTILQCGNRTGANGGQSGVQAVCATTQARCPMLPASIRQSPRQRGPAPVSARSVEGYDLCARVAGRHRPNDKTLACTARQEFGRVELQSTGNQCWSTAPIPGWPVVVEGMICVTHYKYSHIHTL